MLEPNDLKKGTFFKYRGAPQQVLDYSHAHKGRGSAVVTAKIKNLINGSVQTLTLKAGDKLEEADLVRKKATFLYHDKEHACFMDTESYEQILLPRATLANTGGFLKEGSEVMVIEFEGTPITVSLPPKIELTVTRTEPGVKGDTASGTAYKPATLETGMTIQVPLFVKEGDVIRINTETGEYVERVM